jgi:transcriptional regulator with XRE-family HTH domain
MQLRGIFASNLRSIRIRKGLSQEALANLAGIDRTYVSALERSVYSVSLDTIEKLAITLKVHPELLLSDTAREDSEVI